jgi:hypothetical protein
MKLICIGLAAALAALVAAASSAASEQAPGFRVGIEAPVTLPVTPAYVAALRDMGIGYVNYFVTNAPGFDRPEAEINAAMMAVCDTLGLDFSLACHHRNPAPETVRAAAANKRFLGVLVDELEHIRLMFPQFAPIDRSDMLADPSTFTSLEQAHDAALAGFRRLRERFAAQGAPGLTATHVWPAMLHMAARAGCTPCPKICKEFYSTVSLAIGMGAARQYSRPLWVDTDMWYYALVPGHPAEEVRANLQLAYWLGADLVYLEGSGYNVVPAGKQGDPFSLVNLVDESHYQLTPHGEMLKAFCREYLPANPRTWTFRDVRPEMAIVRFDDTDFGQKSWGADRLYGTEALRSDRDTAAWLRLWNVLTWGKTGTDAISYFKPSIKQPVQNPRYHQDVIPSYLTDAASAEHRFFVPLNGVVVYDHMVGYDLLKGIPVLFLTGKTVSQETMAAIERCVSEGATCVAWGPLAARHGLAWTRATATVRRGRGRFVLTDDFAAPAAVRSYRRHLGKPDEISYRFGDHQVVLRRVTDNTVDVSVTSPAK